MELLRRGAGGARQVALLPGAWNPPTRAHLALAEAARAYVQEVLLALPGVFPHKGIEEVDLDTRLAWLSTLAATRDWVGVATGGSGLFIEMVRGLKASAPAVEQVYIACGSDAAQRFLDWDYGQAPGVEEQLREFTLLVAPRGAPFAVPERLRAFVHPLEMEGWDEYSSTELRERIRRGEGWAHLAPEEIGEELERAYRGTRK